MGFEPSGRCGLHESLQTPRLKTLVVFCVKIADKSMPRIADNFVFILGTVLVIGLIAVGQEVIARPASALTSVATSTQTTTSQNLKSGSTVNSEAAGTTTKAPSNTTVSTPSQPIFAPPVVRSREGREGGGFDN